MNAQNMERERIERDATDMKRIGDRISKTEGNNVSVWELCELFALSPERIIDLIVIMSGDSGALEVEDYDVMVDRRLWKEQAPLLFGQFTSHNLITQVDLEPGKPGRGTRIREKEFHKANLLYSTDVASDREVVAQALQSSLRGESF